MDKARIYEELREQIEAYLSYESFRMEDGYYDDMVCHDFELSNGFSADCLLVITGYHHYDRGDYYNPPEEYGEINCEVREMNLYDENGEYLSTESYVTELSTSTSY